MDETLDTPIDDTPADPPASLRDSLSAAYDEHAEDAPETPAAAPASDKPTTSPTTAEEDVVDPAEFQPERPIPERLKAKFGDKWATLDPAIRSEFHEYETSIGRLASKYGQDAKQWNQVQQTFAPYREMVTKEGGDFFTATRNLLETARLLRVGSPEQKRGIIQTMISTFGVDLRAGVAGETPDQPGSTVPGDYANLSPALLDRIARIEQNWLTKDAQEHENLRTRVDNDLNTFLADTANVYTQEPGFLETMAQLIQVGRAEGLEDAYKQAAWLHDGPRAVEMAKANQIRTANRAAQAKRARTAAVSVNGNAPGNVRLDAGKMSLRDTLSAAYDGDLDS
jgi:hypothetical protein